MNILPLGYQVGALLYSPSLNSHIADTLIKNKIKPPFSLALCLEDTIHDDYLPQAEMELERTLRQIFCAYENQPFYLPKLFIRVRSPEQLLRLVQQFAPFSELITGFVLPKFFIDNCGAYITAIKEINTKRKKPYYFMPIFESAEMIDLTRRYEGLYAIKKQLESVSSVILNIRVGGNDLCHAFSLRRHVDQTIYDIKPVSNLLTDVFTAFGADYVVSGPVWEYYSGEQWQAGLEREQQLDILNGFVGKTAIHPCQVPVITQQLRISQTDYEDALSIVNWGSEQGSMVAGGNGGARMNEYKSHSNWAQRTLILAAEFGIQK